MRHRALRLAVLALAALVAFPAMAQHSSGGFRMRGHSGAHSSGHFHSGTNTGNPNFNFIPGFGLQPVVHERFAPGFGFDATHHTLIHGNRFQHGFHGFFGGRFHNPNFTFGFGGFFPFFPAVSSGSSVVIVQQPAQPIVVPVVIDNDSFNPGGEIVVAAGLPDDWPRLRVAASSYAPQQEPLPAIILLVRKNEIIVPAVDYWLEDDLIFYVTSTGRQGSFPLRDLDWNMTTRLNAERGYEFALRTVQ